jgi:hypothetical protein
MAVMSTLQRWTMRIHRRPIFPCEHCPNSAGHAKQMAKHYPLPLPAAAFPAGPVLPRRLHARHPPAWDPPRHRRQRRRRPVRRPTCNEIDHCPVAVVDERRTPFLIDAVVGGRLLYTSTPTRAGDGAVMNGW